MRGNINKFVYWTPRILGIIFVCFLTLFSLDVFEEDVKYISTCESGISCIAPAIISEGHNFWRTILAFFIHSIPSIILTIILIISWKREIVGGIVFTLAGIVYIIMTIANANVAWYIIIIMVTYNSWSSISYRNFVSC